MIQAFTTENWKKIISFIPKEDSFNFDENTFAVADGVTRDPLEYLPDIKTLKGKLAFAWNYKRPSPAKVAADLFCITSTHVLKDFDIKDKTAITEAFEISNNKIKEYNNLTFDDIDYLTNDFAGCVASLAVKNKEYVHFGFISDCGVAIFDEKGNLKFRTEDEGPLKYKKERWSSEQMKRLSWENPEARIITRRDFRNNPENPYSFGVLTGEDTAMHYVKIRTQEIRPSEHLIVYTDGLEDVIFSNEFVDRIRQKDNKGLKKLCQKRVKTEGTLIHPLVF